jgi:uncharacterized protein YjiS (DUF1127 family)
LLFPADPGDKAMCDDHSETRLLQRLLSVMLPARARHSRRRVLARDVSTLNDHLLRDIGLDRIDVRERRK